MALIKCNECGKEVSDKAATCPNCGAPVNNQEPSQDSQAYQGATVAPQQTPKKKIGCGCLVFILAFIAIIGLAVRFIDPDVKTSSPANKEDAVLDKEMAGELDDTVWGITIKVIKSQNNMMNAMDGYANSQISELGFYDFCKEVSEYCAKVNVSYPDSKDKGAQQYIRSCETLALYVQTEANSLITYINSKSTEDLSKAKEDIEKIQDAMSIVISNRVVFL